MIFDFCLRESAITLSKTYLFRNGAIMYLIAPDSPVGFLWRFPLDEQRRRGDGTDSHSPRLIRHILQSAGLKRHAGRTSTGFRPSLDLNEGEGEDRRSVMISIKQRKTGKSSLAALFELPFLGLQLLKKIFAKNLFLAAHCVG